jgi:hypothetical protein
MTSEQASNTQRRAHKRLMQALEAGQSEVLKNYLRVMSSARE